MLTDVDCQTEVNIYIYIQSKVPMNKNDTHFWREKLAFTRQTHASIKQTDMLHAQT
jgi:hypothetical protein